MVLTLSFPPAMRIIESLEPVYDTSPTKVKHVANVVEDVLQAYGRCVLATDESPDGGNATQASRSAESYRSWRTRLSSALDEIQTDLDPVHEDALASASRASRDLVWTLDKVLHALNVRCSIVSSGLQV